MNIEWFDNVKINWFILMVYLPLDVFVKDLFSVYLNLNNKSINN